MNPDSITKGEATYCPEDNKLRLYVGRVPREEYLALRAQGWTALHKQRESGGGDFVATWTPARRGRALLVSDGFIGDEDMGPAERAADRAERFAGYREKRTEEATGHADRFDSAPQAHGYQSQARAERAAARHDRIADRATDAWGKAEYWQRRTAGVISHALYKSAPGVRMGRIKEIEADLRRTEAAYEKAARLFRAWEKVRDIADPVEQTKAAIYISGSVSVWSDYPHPDDPAQVSSIYDHLTTERRRPITGAEACAMFFSDHTEPEIDKSDWANHYKMRLAYENQMLEAQGGRAAFVEMEPGGWIGERQIRKVNKSNATGRVVSVEVMGATRHFTKESGYKLRETRACPVLINIERLPADAYRAPTEEDKKALADTLAAEKQARPKKDPCPLINPTDADAERLAALWNEARRADFDKHTKGFSEFKPCEVRRMPQAFYSEHSKGSYAKAETRKLCALGRLEERNSFYDYSGQAERAKARGPALCQIRTTGFDPVHVIILTDKPQKPLPESVWQQIAAELVNA